MIYDHSTLSYIHSACPVMRPYHMLDFVAEA